MVLVDEEILELLAKKYGDWHECDTCIAGKMKRDGHRYCHDYRYCEDAIFWFIKDNDPRRKQCTERYSEYGDYEDGKEDMHWGGTCASRDAW